MRRPPASRAAQRVAIRRAAHQSGQPSAAGSARTCSRDRSCVTAKKGLAPQQDSDELASASRFSVLSSGHRARVAYEVIDSTLGYEGAILRVRSDTVVQPDGSRTAREVVDRGGSVGIVAIDDQRRVLLIRQYRHGAGQSLWGLPAGLRDRPGEAPLDTARRALANTGWTADDWDLLVDLYPSPDACTELCRIYQAGQLRQVKQPAQPREAGNAPQRWFQLANAVHGVLAGYILHGLPVTGLLAAGVRHGLPAQRVRSASHPLPGG